MRTKTYIGRSLQQVLADIEAEAHDRGLRTTVLKIDQNRAGGLLGLLGAGRVAVTVAMDEPVEECTEQRSVARSERRPPDPTPPEQHESKQACRRSRSHTTKSSRASKSATSQRNDSRKTAPPLPIALQDIRRRMLEQEIAPEHIDRIITEVAVELGERAATDRTATLDALERHLARRLPVSGPLMAVPNGQRVAVFVGPTGVGKTTTIAKLAAHCRFTERSRIALVTIDAFRIAATDQLRTFAQILDVPFEAAASPAELRAAIHRHGDKDIILLDTAGQTPAHPLRVAELRSFLAGIRPVETYLLLNAGIRLRDAERCMQCFAPLEPDRLIFTKLDETICFGSLFELVQRYRLPVAYLTTGQNVPQDIMRAESHSLARIILGGGQCEQEAC